MDEPNYFVKEPKEVLEAWDGHIYMRNVKDETDMMELTQPLPCGEGEIPTGFRWNGASGGVLRSVPILGFPKWKHPIASCKHDFRCWKAGLSKKLRELADTLFKSDVGVRGTKWEQFKGFLGVRIGAFFGVGVSK